MAIQMISPDNRRMQEQMALIQLLGQAGQQGTQNYLAGQDREQLLQAQTDVAAALGGASGQFTPGQLDPTKMDVGSGAGTLGGMPGAPGTAPTRGMIPNMTRELALAMLRSGQGDALMSQAFPGGADPVAVKGALVDPRTGRVIYQAPAEIEAPKMRDRLEGDQRVFEQWNPQTNAWDPLSSGPAFATPAAPQFNYNEQPDLDPADQPIPISELDKLIGPDGNPLPVGTTYRQAQERGVITQSASTMRGAAGEAEAAAAAKAQSQGDQASVINRELDRVEDFLNDPDSWTGAIGKAASLMPGSAAHTASTSLETIKANLTLDTLIEAKANGAAFGSFSDTELRMLASVAGGLDVSGDPEVLAENLEYVRAKVNRGLEQRAPAAAPPPSTGAMQPGAPAPAAATAAPQMAPPGATFDDLMRKYGG